MIYLIPFLISILPIFMINWCAKKEDEYPNIKLDEAYKKIICFVSTLFILELTTFFFLRFKNNTSNIELYFIWSVILLLISISYIDWKTSLIPNRYSYSFIAIGFISVIYNIVFKNAIFLDWDAQIISFIIIFVSFVLLYFISKNGIGMGDVKIVATSSFFLGVSQLALMLFISSGCILIYEIIVKIIAKDKFEELPNNDLPLDSDSDVVNGRVMGLSKINNHTAIVMGPFLSVAFLISYIFGEMIINWWFVK